MRAAVVERLDGPSAIRVVDRPEPDGDGVRIAVAAAGVTFPDALLTRGLYQLRPEPPFVPGSEVSGVVTDAPSGSGFAPGQRVAAFPGLGGFAETVVVPPHLVFALPDEVDTEVAAGLPMNLLTVHFALLDRGRLQPGERVLVHGAAGGIGVAAIQLAAARGAYVIAVTSSEDKAEVARVAGAHEVVAVEGFRDAVQELTAGEGVDLVLDPVGGDRVTDSLRCLRRRGRLLVVGFTAGEIPAVKVNRLLLNNLDVVGVGWGAYWLAEPGYPAQQWADLLPDLRAGRLLPPIGARHRLEGAADAVASLEERRATGKVLLLPGS
ncbi:MAG: NADPH:quinone oxidoreductase family protein [Nitriliruptoraceae bacterium]